MASEAPLHWRNPPAIQARCPKDPDKILKFGISNDITGHGRDNWRRTPLYMVWAHLHAQLPPINNVGYIERDELKPTLCTLLNAKACFCGIKRPHLAEDEGDSVLVYVLKPAATLRYDPERGMVAPIRAMLFPPAAVLTVQVRLTASLQQPVDELDGAVTRLEPVAGEKPEYALPLEHATRYARRCW